jgi:subtilisin family serine protease
MAKPKKSKKTASRAGARKPVARKPSARAFSVKAVPERALHGLDLGAKADAPNQPGAKGAANTIIYVHGIANKPIASVLKCQWDRALTGTQLGDRSRMAYWVNRNYYPTPLDETCASGDFVTSQIEEGASLLARAAGVDGSATIESQIAQLTANPARQDFLMRIAEKMQRANTMPKRGIAAQDMREKILPLPDFLRRWITQGLTEAFLRDVNDFFFVEERRKAMEDSLMERLAAGGGPFVVIGHSQGSMIAYDVLRRLNKAQFQVPLFITIGSPLGIDEVQAVFRQWTGGSGKLPFPPCVEKWVNVADRIDPVALDSDISNDFDGEIENHAGLLLNPDSPRHPHSATGYLSTGFVRDPVRATVGSAFLQSIAPFAIAKDLAAALEDGHSSTRHEVLIQLTGDKVNPDLDEVAKAVGVQIRRMVRDSKDPDADPQIERLKHFICARLTRQELETMRSQYNELKIQGIWRNAAKRALIVDSTNTVQARPANLGYGADGEDICWAVLDTGIHADHPHFAEYDNIQEQWDCTQRGAAVRIAKGTNAFATLDGNGHGTHVAGIIAGKSAAIDQRGKKRAFEGMAPRCSLIGLKVLDNRGDGNDSWIIKALDLVADMNEKAGKLVVHGLNLSLGGGFDPSAFGCGHTPLCQEIRRLWQQGVLVCLAAGNEGYAVLNGTEGEIPANMDLSIGDPANLEEAIAVGSVHKTNPHTYGISYFSSRGPTADGRRKPDVVAPGEKILSARHDWKQTRNDVPKIDDLYVAMSGTSMATPHVSGLLAAFVSLRREFIGYPDRVKAILMEACIDLRRDPYMQGAGLPNLIKMLAFN